MPLTQPIRVEFSRARDAKNWGRIKCDGFIAIRCLAEKAWTTSRKESRIAHTVVLKLKTADFNILTRSHTFGSPPSSWEELATIALGLRDRIQLPL
jgi:nucleotidyltransferase/DNA polymerase involved in DNA repair